MYDTFAKTFWPPTDRWLFLSSCSRRVPPFLACTPPPNVKLHSLAPLLPFHLWLPLTALSGTAMAVRIVVVPPSCAGTLLAADNQWQSEWLRSAVTVRWTADQAVNQHQRTPNGPTKGVKCSGGPKKPPGIFPRSTKVVCWC